MDNIAARLLRRSPSIVLMLVLGSAVLLSSCKRVEEPPAPEIRPVRVVKIEQRAGGDTVALTGTIQAQTEINLSFRIDGRMVERSVNVGDTVKPGQVIARLDPQNEESTLQSARAQLAAARARQSEARNNFARMKDLVSDNSVSRAAFEQSESAMKTADSQVEATQTQVTLAENRLGYTRLVSDVAGVVTVASVEPGEVVGPGRMVVQVAREGGRDAAFDVPARVKDAVTTNGEFAVALVSDPKVTASGHDPRDRAARRPGHRHVPRQGPPQGPAAGDAPRQHRRGPRAPRRRVDDRGAAIRGDPFRPADCRVGRRSQDEHGRDARDRGALVGPGQGGGGVGPRAG